MVLYGLEYAHTISHIKGALVEAMPRTKLELIFANVMCSIINSLEDHRKSDRLGYLGSFSSVNSLGAATCTRCSLGGLIWDLLEGRRMEDYLLLWIGPDNSAFSNIVLTFNGCEIGRHVAMFPQILPSLNMCDVFIYVSCAQTALLDGKEFLAPVITPFEAMLAFSRSDEKHPRVEI